MSSARPPYLFAASFSMACASANNSSSERSLPAGSDFRSDARNNGMTRNRAMMNAMSFLIRRLFEVDSRETRIEFALGQRRLQPISRSTQRATRLVAPIAFGALMSWSSAATPGLRRRLAKALVALALFCVTAWVDAAQAASDLKTYLPKIAPADFFPGADRFGPPQGDPPIAPVYRGDQ